MNISMSQIRCSDDCSGRTAPEQQARIDELKKRAADAAGGEMTACESAKLDADVQEAFWERVAAFEEAPERPLTDRLREAGIELTSPGELDDAALHERLWMVLHKLAEWRTYLCFTNHLADRELYALLLDEVLPQPDKELPPELGYNTTIDVSQYAADEQFNQTYLRYYADEQERAMWAEGFPEDTIPPHEDPPHDRDERLPEPREPQ